jgi:hypothetical protein
MNGKGLMSTPLLPAAKQTTALTNRDRRSEISGRLLHILIRRIPIYGEGPFGVCRKTMTLIHEENCQSKLGFCEKFIALIQAAVFQSRLKASVQEDHGDVLSYRKPMQN